MHIACHEVMGNRHGTKPVTQLMVGNIISLNFSLIQVCEYSSFNSLTVSCNHLVEIMPSLSN